MAAKPNPKRDDGKHRRPTAAELDERVSIPLPPATVIEGMTQVDAAKVAKAMPKRDRTKRD